MRLRDSQRQALAAGAMDHMRRRRLLELRERGFEVRQEPADGAVVVCDAAGGWARIESLGLRARVESAEGRVTEIEQYPGGRIRRIRDPSGREVRFERDPEGFLQAIDRGPGGGIHRFQLSGDWRPLRIYYPDGTCAQTQYAPSGQPTQIINRDGTEIRYEYAPDGRLAALIDPQGRRIKLSDQGPGVSRRIEYPNGDRHEFIDDPGAGLLRLDINGETQAWYQETGEESFEARYRQGSRERFVFSEGRLVEAVNEHAAVKLTYDRQGRLLSEDTDGRVVRYLRNEVGALVGIVTPEGETLSYARDRDQRLTGITDWTGGRYEIPLPPAGPPAEMRYPNGVTAATTLNAMGLPATWTLGRSSDPLRRMDAAAWEYDECDRLVAATRDGLRREYRYDRASRLAAVQGADTAWNEHFELDPSGNRVRSAGAPCEYDPLNRLLRQGEREFRYDGLGNRSGDRQGPQSTSYVYDGRNRLVAVETTGRRIEYGYDALGRRIFKRADGVTTCYQWAGTQLLSESVDDGQRTVRRDYLCCPEFLTPLAFREEGAVYYLHCGRLQEPLCVTDQAGEVAWKADYLAFGRARVSLARVRQPWRLPGQYHDEETGLHYAVARYYDPELGRFLSMDPLRVAGTGLNYYTYCDGDPVNRVDPTGEISLTLGTVLTAMAVGAVVGAAIGAGIELYRQRNQEQTDWGQVGRSALIGGCLGAIGGAVGAVAEAALLGTLGVLGAGAAAGALGAAAEYCVEAAGKGEWNWDEFGTSVAAGAAVGAVTAGIGGIIAARAARRAAQEAAEAAREAEARLAREALERAARERAAREAAEQAAAREAEEKAAREAAENAAKEARAKRLEELSHDLDRGGVDATTRREAEAALDLEDAGKLKPPIRRPNKGEHGDFIDGNGQAWDHKGPMSRDKLIEKIKQEAREKGKPEPKLDPNKKMKGEFNANDEVDRIKSEISKGEKVIIDTRGLNAADKQALQDAIAKENLGENILWYP